MPKVLNKYKDPVTPNSVYIGRPSKWGNPIKLEKGGDRDLVYKQYCDWLETQPELIAQAKQELKGKDLICYCAPLRCHGDRLLEVVNETKPSTTVTMEIPYNPLEDGITHINLYSKGRTELGRKLTHFAPIGFEHPEHGKFASVEAYWYWCSTGKKWDHLRSLHGFKAKQEGKLLEQIKYPTFMADIEEANRLKITQNPELLEAFKTSILPLTHYYAFGSGVDYKAVAHWSTPWFEKFFTKLRRSLRGKPLRVLVAGSRSIQDYEVVYRAIEESGYNVGTLISGVANGPDRLGFRYAKQHNIPVEEFPADWEQYGKRAGMIRNSVMGETADVAIIIWDGVSVGTKNMIEVMRKLGKPVYLVTVPPTSPESTHA